MSALATLLAGLGHEVTGSDLQLSPALRRLSESGIVTWTGSRPDSMSGVELVVTSSAVPSTDAEVVAASELGVPVWDRPRLLEEITARTPTIGPTGTHGKTTSTGLLLAAVRGAGYDPSFAVGGDLMGQGTNAGVGSDDLLVLEVDEAFGTFLTMRLQGLIVTNVEADHLDYYQTVGRLEEAFVDVARRVDGPVVACSDDPGARRVAEAVGATTYGLGSDADMPILGLETDDTRVRFRFMGHDVVVAKPGEHIARNAAGVLSLLVALGMDLGGAIAGLATFRGIARRYEIRGTAGGVTVIDDYAHHPTEIATTIRAARAGTTGRVIVVFQPHRYTRTAELHAQFGGAFSEADEVVVTGIYAAGEAPIPGVDGGLIADAINTDGSTDVVYIEDRRRLGEFVADRLREGDLVLTLGAGDITTLGSELIQRLARR